MSTSFGRLLVVAVAALAVGTLAAQSPTGMPPAQTPVPTGLIVGQTVDGVTGAAVGYAVVSIARAALPVAQGQPAAAPLPPLTQPRIVSDASGRFMFRDLSAGTYSLSASKAGYADAILGKRTATEIGGQPMILKDGERRGDVKLGLWKHAALGGTVVDEAGEPAIGVKLRVFRRMVFAGRLRFTPYGSDVTTDDRGVYRRADLPPGDYVVGIVTTQTTVPTSLQEASGAASKAGTLQQFQRELDRSRGLSLGGIGASSPGQRVGSLLLATPQGLGSAFETLPVPIRNGRVFVYPTVFYPAASTLSRAAVVSLGGGEERSAIDFQIRPVVTSRVSGVLLGPTGPEVHTSIDLIPGGPDEQGSDLEAATATTSTDATGAFTFLGVVPGNYVLRSTKVPPRPMTTSSMTTVIQTGTTTFSTGSGVSTPPPIPNEPTWWASTTVVVGENDVTGLTVTLRSGARLSGRVEFEGAATKPNADRLMQTSVQIDNAEGRPFSGTQFQMARGVIDAEGRFNTYQLPAGRYVVRAGPMTGWQFKGAFLNGRDITDAPLEVAGEDIGNIELVYTDRSPELTGSARSAAGADLSATVLVFPASPTLWTNYASAPRRLRAVRVGANGVFRVPNLPVGDYIVVATSSRVPPTWMDPAYLKKLSTLGTTTTIADRETKTLDLSVKEIR